MASREVLVQSPRDTVVLGNTNAIFLSRFSGDVARCLRSLAERSQVSQRKPKSSLFSAGGHGDGRETTKN